MKKETLVLTELLGANSNKPKQSQTLQPWKLHNFEFDNRGGYRPFARVRTPTELVGEYDYVFGYDESGLMSFVDDDLLHLYTLGNGRVTQTNTAYPNPFFGSHIPGVGLYHARDQFLVYNQDYQLVEPYNYAPIIKSSTATEPQPVTVFGPNILALAQKRASSGELLLALSDGSLRVSPDDGESFTTVANPFGVNVKRLEANASAFVALTVDNRLFRSVDGVTWNISTPFNPGVAIAAMAGNALGEWMAVSETNRIYYSKTDAASWIESPTSPLTSSAQTTFTGVAFAAGLNAWVLSSNFDSPLASEYFYSLNGITVGETIVNNSKRAQAIDVAAFGDKVLMVTRPGDGNFLDVFYDEDKPVNDLASWVDKKANEVGLPSIPGQIQRVKAWNNIFATSGTTSTVNGETGYGVYFTTGDLTKWQPITTNSPFGTPNDILVTNDGRILIASAQTLWTAEVGGDVGAGDYEVIWFDYIETKAGKLVTNLGKEAINFSSAAGNSITVTAPPNPISAQHFTEVYLKAAPTSVDENGIVQQEDIDTRDAILVATLEPGDSENIASLPLVNKTLPNTGQVGTLAYDGAATFHNARVWAKPAANLSKYEYLDDVELDFANLQLSLIYSHLEYVNLGGITNTLLLPSSTSQGATALVSSPSGVLAMTKQDTFLISGDAALDNLSRERYPDIVGCDPGVVPATLGGITFTIWNGEAYALNGGQAQKIAEDVWNPSIGWGAVSVDARRKQVCLRPAQATGEVYRVDLDTGYCFEDSFTANVLLPDPDEGMVYITPTTTRIITTPNLGLLEISPPYIEYRLDFGDTTGRHSLRRVRLTLETIPPLLPVLYYQLSPNHPDIALQSPVHSVVAELREDELTFTLPLGFHTRRSNIRILFPSYEDETIVNPRIVFEYIPQTRRVR